ncbi:MAG: tRNA 2-selenouridine(34) synthase MnmH [Sedimentibacter sp.]|uniref:tRNA 2-selenouridine(34) synthase MnmH n=1 Tax=Sedimentibacter sp. TaxID=1960295 RepID=UPI0031581427
MNTLKYCEAKDKFFFIDVRSPSEYEDDTIPGAVNIPLLNDDERKQVGTTYVQVGKTEAKRLGVKLISPKMPDMFEQVVDLKYKHGQLAAFCARGGYRSTYFASVFSSIGIPVFQLEGGYKSYRKEVMESLPKLNDRVTYIVLSGNTGVGKTDILHCLRSLGCSVLDLEGAANHRGSLLGSIGIGDCNSQKKFETNIYDQLMNTRDSYVFVEAESQKIGSVTIPKYISDRMKQGIQIFVEADIDYRVQSLKKDYILNADWKAESAKAMDRLNKYISRDKLEELKHEIMQGNFDLVARELMEKYYDPMYNFKSDKLNYAARFKAKTDSREAAGEIFKWYNDRVWGRCSDFI